MDSKQINPIQALGISLVKAARYREHPGVLYRLLEHQLTQQNRFFHPDTHIGLNQEDEALMGQSYRDLAPVRKLFKDLSNTNQAHREDLALRWLDELIKSSEETNSFATYEMNLGIRNKISHLERQYREARISDLHTAARTDQTQLSIKSLIQGKKIMIRGGENYQEVYFENGELVIHDLEEKLVSEREYASLTPKARSELWLTGSRKEEGKIRIHFYKKSRKKPLRLKGYIPVAFLESEKESELARKFVNDSLIEFKPNYLKKYATKMQRSFGAEDQIDFSSQYLVLAKEKEKEKGKFDFYLLTSIRRIKDL